MKKSQKISYLLIFSMMLFPWLATAQQNPYEEKVSDILKSKKENQSVMLTAVVSKWLDDKTFIVDDKTANINILVDTNEKPDLISGDEITLSGKVKLNVKGEKEIVMTSFRKLKFIKDPANCCRPEVE